jgi:hypothetical protein
VACDDLVGNHYRWSLVAGRRRVDEQLAGQSAAMDWSSWR